MFLRLLFCKLFSFLFVYQQTLSTLEPTPRMATEQSKDFKMGEQPEWAGKEPNADLPTSFIETLLKENNADSLIHRGYCVVELDEQTTDYYSKFHADIEQFFNSEEREKQKYAMLQFEKAMNSPNQCHGYSKVSNLKEQFMMRCIGKNTQFVRDDKEEYIFPECGSFGKYGQLIYQTLDMKSRQLAKETMKKLGKLENSVDDILDPINEICQNMEDNVSEDGKHTFSSFMPDEYISSSIMDNFHYFAPSKEKHEKFYNNHASHTDSGLMTVVITTDEPGLEILDQKTNQWVQIEALMQRYLKESGQYEKDPLCHRKYATFFWSDSVEYLNNAPVVDTKKEKKELKPLFHRVADCENERYSVVFKQRSAPLRTHCRYQEDYILASIQQKVDTKSKNAYTLWDEAKKSQNQNNGWMYGTAALLSLALVSLFVYNNSRK